jgi:predicted metal-binding protein
MPLEKILEGSSGKSSEKSSKGSVEYGIRLAGMEELTGKYRFERKFMALCEECHNYGANWACPPFGFDTGEYAGRYSHAYLVIVKWTHSAKTIAANDTIEKSASYSHALFRDGKAKMLTLLRRLENEWPGSAAVSAGGCVLCAECDRARKAPCPRPDEIRHSLESLGFDIAALAKDFFGVEILWGKGSLPEYQVLLNALFTKGNRDGAEQEIRE